MTHTPMPVLLDCDPGVDDALAILWLAAHPDRFDLRAVTCAAGNVGLELTSANARRMLEMVGRGDIPVHAGAHRPIMSAVGPVSKVHGSDGLGDVDLPAPTVPLAHGHGAEAIIRAARAAEGRLHLLATGPLTNVALALLLEPALTHLIDGITLMGGSAFGPGNRTPLAEFNFHVDPHAAAIVFDSGIPITMAGLDVTRQAVLSAEVMTALAALPAPVGPVCTALLRGYKDPCLHDPVVVAWWLNPDLFQIVPAHVSINCQPGDTAGQSITAVSEKHLRGRAPNAHVMTGLDQPGFEALFRTSMTRLSEALV